jgi:hypothetical protein
MDKADTITKQLLQRQSDKNFRKRALDTLAVFEAMYAQSSSPPESYRHALGLQVTCCMLLHGARSPQSRKSRNRSLGAPIESSECIASHARAAACSHAAVTHWRRRARAAAAGLLAPAAAAARASCRPQAMGGGATRGPR